MRLLLAVALTAPVFLETAHAQSADDDRAYELFVNGQSLFREGRYEQSILAWEEAYRLSKRANILFNIASAQERLGQTQKAIDTLFTYKAFATADKRDQVERRIRALEARLAEEQANPPQPVPDPVPQPNPVVPVPVPVPTPAPPSPRGGPPVAGITLLGAGIAVAGGGVGLGIVSSSAKTEARESCVATGDTLLCSKDAEAALARHRTTGILADVGFAVGAIAAGTGIVLIATHKKGAETGTSATLSVGLDRVSIRGRF